MSLMCTSHRGSQQHTQLSAVTDVVGCGAVCVVHSVHGWVHRSGRDLGLPCWGCISWRQDGVSAAQPHCGAAAWHDMAQLSLWCCRDCITCCAQDHSARYVTCSCAAHKFDHLLLGHVRRGPGADCTWELGGIPPEHMQGACEWYGRRHGPRMCCDACELRLQVKFLQLLVASGLHSIVVAIQRCCPVVTAP